MKTQQVALSKGVHRGKPALLIRFNNDLTLNTLIKNIHGVHWSGTMKCWFTPFNQAHVEAVKLVMKDKAKVLFDDEPLPEILRLHEPEHQQVKINQHDSDQHTFEMQMKRFRIWLEQKGYRENTIQTYLRAMAQFRQLCANKPLKKATHKDYLNFKEYLKTRKYCSKTYLALQASGIAKFYKVVLGITIDQPINLTAGVPTKICTHDEMMHIISCTTNLKSRTMLLLMYSCGLRCGELLAIKPADIKAASNELIVGVESKRIVPLSNSLIHMLRLYFKQFQPVTYLFEGQTPGAPFLEVNVVHAFRKAALKAGINQHLQLKSLRITLANYLMEHGAGLNYVLEYLGHPHEELRLHQLQDRMRS